ncbi:MAG: transposase family protein [Firmicutes bacterium]|nr:transposase family protein [Bacillota bacterium]
MKMYKIKTKQMEFSDFNQPLGLSMNPNNRWINKAEIIPWMN